MGKRLETAHQATDLVFKWELMGLTALAFAGALVPHYVVDDAMDKIEKWWDERRSPQDTKPEAR